MSETEVEIRMLRRRVAELVAQNVDLRKAQAAPMPERVSWEWGLSPGERRIVAELVRHEVVSREVLHLVLRPGKPCCDAKGLDVFICRLRKKLAKHGATIVTLLGVGYALDAETRARLTPARAEAA